MIVKLLKSKWFWLSIVATLVVGGIWVYATRDTGPEYVTDIVERGTLVQTVEATGELQSIDEVNLSFDTSGTVGTIDFQEGESVLAGQKIAMLDAQDLEAEVDKARQAVAVAQAALSLENAGSTSEAIAVAQAGVDVAQAALTGAQTRLTNAQTSLNSTILVRDADVAEKTTAYVSAEEALSNTVAQNEQDVSEAEDDLVSTMKSNMISIRSALSDADEILGVNNSLANDDFESILSHQNPSFLSMATSSYKQAVVARDTAEAAVFALTSASSSADIDSAALLVESAFTLTGTTLLNTRQALDATSVDTFDFSLADLELLKSSIDAARDTVQLEESGFISDLQGLESAEITAMTNFDNATSSANAALQALSTAQATRSDAIATAESAVSSAEVDVSIAQADLNKAYATLSEVQAGPRGVDVAGLVAEVERAQADLEAANARLEKAEIISPIDGVVTRIEIEVGEQVTAGTDLVTVQSTADDLFRVVTDVSESDITKVAQGDIVDVTFDAFGDDTHFSGSVSVIDPAEKQVEGVTFYEVEISLNENEGTFKPGLSADVTIQTELIADALIVPQRAILERDGEKYVRIPMGREFEERVIQTGVRGDDGRTQVLSGLVDGDEVIITILE